MTQELRLLGAAVRPDQLADLLFLVLNTTRFVGLRVLEFVIVDSVPRDKESIVGIDAPGCERSIALSEQLIDAGKRRGLSIIVRTTSI
jgi:hypothetical protein